jgi:hypothetical protein
MVTAVTMRKSREITSGWAICPPKRIVAPKVRVFIDDFAAHTGAPPYWDRVSV